MASKINDYKQAISIIGEILTGKTTREDVMGIILKIAENHPAVLVEAKALAADVEQGLENMVISFLRVGQKIMAIKEYRDITGFGLREAKDAVDDIEKRMIEADTERAKHANL